MGSEISVSSEPGHGSTFSFLMHIDENPHEDQLIAESLNDQNQLSDRLTLEDVDLSEGDQLAEEIKQMSTKTIQRFNTEEEKDGNFSLRTLQEGFSSELSSSQNQGTIFGG